MPVTPMLTDHHGNEITPADVLDREELADHRSAQVERARAQIAKRKTQAATRAPVAWPDDDGTDAEGWAW